MKLAGILILATFYAVYLGKMILQRKQGIRTNQMAKGKRHDKVYYTELILKFATYSVVVVEILNIFLMENPALTWMTGLGLVIGVFGDVVFTMAVLTMKDSWRAGLAEEDKTELITAGIYQISRNPAFLGFDCVYVGILIMFFNLPLLVFSGFAMVMLHLQILQEEKYLSAVFGQEYIEYQKQVCRYIGRKRAGGSR